MPKEPAYSLNVSKVKELRKGLNFFDYSILIAETTGRLVSESTLWRIENLPDYNASLRDILAIAQTGNVADFNVLIKQPPEPGTAAASGVR